MVWSARDALMRTVPAEDRRCADCDVSCEDLPWEADHEVPLWAGGTHDLANLRVRCVPCHDAKTRREARERAAQRREAAGA